MNMYVPIDLFLAGSAVARVADRLEAERQALAALDHPNMGKVMDAGTTDAGRPFFFTERIQGIPLTRFCEARQLAMAARLTLFRQICSTIAYAHEKEIVHRNLTPNSILVEALDDRPVAKIVDFALVKAVNAVAFTEETLLSALGTMEGTDLYMAPEQAGPIADWDTRTDIYALGAILFELLTGITPIHAAILKGATCGEILQAIRENRLPAPSEYFKGCGALQRLVATRRIELDELEPFARGELDRIVMKALANEPDRRYQSARAFARDLEHIPIHDAPSPTATSKRDLRISIGRRERRRISAGLVFASAVIGAMSIRWPAAVEAVNRAATEPRQGGAQHHAKPPRSDVIGASRFVVGESLADETRPGEG
jgi:eukaryotic-like serine/threonine-protein kinase